MKQPITGTWRDFGPGILKAWRENGMGRVESFRLVKSPATTEVPHPVSRGKGKKRKPWER